MTRHDENDFEFAFAVVFALAMIALMLWASLAAPAVQVMTI
ncbi:MAG: hypothetical protein OXR84_11110 [Magnetovibrio sp.]|nr:hypothetical protein [Magnetovibrio sp.]